MKSWLVMRLPGVPFSMRLSRSAPMILLILSLLSLGVMVAAISFGEYPVPAWEVVKTVLGLETSNPDYAFVVQTLRLPRVLVGFLVGMGLAVSGAIMQSLTRNVLASPDIIGINAGASLVAVTIIVLLPSVPIALLPISAFIGALLTAALIYGLSRGQGNSTMRLILLGVGIGAIAGAATSILITFGNIYDVSQALIWMTGSVYGRSWEHLWPLLPWVILFVPLAWLLAPSLNVLNLGEDMARGLGNRVEQQRLVLMITSVALAGAAVATAGTVGFVGLMAPHLARQLVGPNHEGLMPTAALTGGFMVILADFCGRSLFAPLEIPCGVMTALVGAPYFLYILYRNRHL
ncbi:MAG: iron ABC transporter permease [Leptolyngbyaceae bacterium]|nr:iron ABC transporter permease [Leptolyngbyaceae bacterium]